MNHEPFFPLLRLHRSLLRQPGSGETCSAWRAHCRQHPERFPRNTAANRDAEHLSDQPSTSPLPADWIPTYDRAAYQQTDPEPLGLADASTFEQIATERLDAAIRLIIATEGPVHRRVLTHRLLRAAGFGRAGSRIQARIKQRLAALATARELENRDAFSALPEQFIVPAQRDWSALPDALRQIDHVAESERMLCLLDAIVEAGSLDIDTAKNNGLHRIGFTRLTQNAWQKMVAPLAALERHAMIQRQGERLVPTARAFPRPPPMPAPSRRSG